MSRRAPAREDLPPLPPAFAKRMRDLLGEDADALLGSLSSTPERGLRVNTLKLSPPDLEQRVPWRLTAVPWCRDGFHVEDPAARPGAHPLHAAGAYYLQDPSAMAPAAALAPAPGERVCDLAAAPGGKTTHLAALMQGRGILVANDSDPARARALVSNVERWGAPHVVVTQADPERLGRIWAGTFDRVLLDAPCSGEGMFRKSAEARRQWNEALVAHCSGTQARLLDAAARLLRAGGLLAYSTCTFELVENEGAVADFLASHPDFVLERLELAGTDPGADATGDATAQPRHGAARLWPHRQRGDGHFVALLRKGEGKRPTYSDGAPAGRRAGYGQAATPPDAAVRAWRAFAETTLGTVPFGDAELLLHGDRMLAAPLARPSAGGVHLLRVGVLLGRVRQSRFEPAHALAMAAPAGGAQVDLTADDPRLLRYLSGEPFPDAGREGWTRVTLEGLALGWGRRSGGALRSLLPRGLTRSRSPAID